MLENVLQGGRELRERQALAVVDRHCDVAAFDMPLRLVHHVPRAVVDYAQLAHVEPRARARAHRAATHGAKFICSNFTAQRKIQLFHKIVEIWEMAKNGWN